MSKINYPVMVSVPQPERLSRWKVLFKWWLFIIPHVVALTFLWLAMLVATLMGMLAIIVSGRYPRRLFDLVVGVNRWSFRVLTYMFLLRDEYPPFSLTGDHPATLEVQYPERLSRKLALTKWWLLALPHYLALYVLDKFLLLLALYGLVSILFTGRYPSGVFYLVRGLLCWYARVGGYMTLLTDQYPPFSLAESDFRKPREPL